MKPARTQEQKCRRLEFKCKLLDAIKDLEQSLISECDLGQAGPYQRIGPANVQNWQGKSNKGSECCCPPGCCKESMVFKPPKLPAKKNASDGHGGNVDPSLLPPSEFGWHDHDHGRGCRPGADGGATGRGGPGGPGGPRGPGGPGGPGPCCYSQGPQAGYQNPPAFKFPQSPEEAIQMGCFVARTC